MNLAILAVGFAWIGLLAQAPKTPPPQAPPAAPPVKAQAPATAAPGSCIQCHAGLIKQPATHAAAEDCSTCHVQDKGNAHRFRPAAEGAALCVSCHEVVTPADKFVHGPVAVGDCVTCHDPHGGPRPKLVRQSGAELCQSCHLEMKAKIAEKRFTHTPVKSDCAGCHSPHASPLKYQLRAAGSALCFQCHKDLAQRIDKAAVKHDAVKMGAQCQTCHDPHASDIAPELRATSMTLCLSCHDKVLATPAGPISNIKAWLAANPDTHGPIRQQDCVACHRPHESEHFRLLKQDYPAKFYSPFDPKNYELCFGCHEPDLVRVERTATVTGFRDGDRNLHFVHVNRPEKGRTCRACHEAHSSTHPRHIRDSVPFGSWALPIKYEATKDGGRCAPGCHVPYEYQRTRKAQQDGPTRTR